MKYKETAAGKRERFNTTVCECGHCQAWHFGKIIHTGPCSFPGCRCNSFKVPR